MCINEPSVNVTMDDSNDEDVNGGDYFITIVRVEDNC